MEVRTATLQGTGHGLAQEVLDNTDVLIWWGQHGPIIRWRTRSWTGCTSASRRGMGLIVLHSGHASKIFQKICGTNSGMLKWREDGGEGDPVGSGPQPSHRGRPG